jgi:hypothetical protein
MNLRLPEMLKPVEYFSSTLEFSYKYLHLFRGKVHTKFGPGHLKMRHLGRFGYTYVEVYRTSPWEAVCNNVGRCHLAQDRDQWCVPLNVVMHVHVP